MSTRKRPRQSEVAEQVADNKAECPFAAAVVDPKEGKEKKNKKRRRTGGGDDEDVLKKQASPFSPVGTFKTHDNMDVHYKIEPLPRWVEMTRYNSFVRMSRPSIYPPVSNLPMRLRADMSSLTLQ